MREQIFGNLIVDEVGCINRNPNEYSDEIGTALVTVFNDIYGNRNHDDEETFLDEGLTEA